MFFFLHSFLPRHHKNHPLMTEEDIATLVFEASVGIDHPISSPEQELQRLHEEMKDLIKCAAVSLTLESDNNRSELLLS